MDAVNEYEYKWHTVRLNSTVVVDVWLPENATEEQLLRAAYKKLGWAVGPHVITVSNEGK